MQKLTLPKIAIVLLLTLLTSQVQAQYQYDLELQMQMPDTLVAGESVEVSGYIKNHGPGSYLGIDLGMNFTISQEMLFDAPVPDFLAWLPPITFIAVNDSVHFTKTIHVDPAEFELDRDNIVIVWPTDNSMDIDPANDYWIKEVFVEDPHVDIIAVDLEGINVSLPDQTEDIEINKSAIEGTNQFSDLVIYPQPCHSFLYLELPGTFDRYILLDSKGRRLQEQRISGSLEMIQTADLPNGWYFLRLTSKSESETRRVLVHH